MEDTPSHDPLEEAIRAAWTGIEAERVAGSSVPGYGLRRELGRGAMGVVYLAHQEKLSDRPVALKVLRPHAAAMPEARLRFRREAEALARIRHPGIVTIHDVVDEDDVAAYAMEWVDGPTLQGLIETLSAKGRPPQLADVAELLGVDVRSLNARGYVDFTCSLALSVARALAAVHSIGLVHRDVKPSNVLLRGDGSPLLSDFGLVRGANDPLWTQTGIFAGTPAYAAPEQLRGERDDLDQRCDIYSLGATLYHLLALETPYPHRSLIGLLEAIESSPPRRLRPDNPQVSRDLETVVRKAMAADPAQRYQTSAELAGDLERVLSEEPIRARRPGVIRKVWRFLRRRRGVFIAASTGAGVAALAVAFATANAFWVPGHVERTVRKARAELLNPGFADLLQTHRDGKMAPSHYANDYLLQGKWDPLVRYPRALRSYDQALFFRPNTPGLRQERDIVGLALELLEGKSPLSKEPNGVLADYARARGMGSGEETLVQRLLEGASSDDLYKLGLLAYLCIDPIVCEGAWNRIDAGLAGNPLVDAAEADLLHSQGDHSRAYPRFLEARRAYPYLGYLSVRVADCALSVGDVEVARRVTVESRGLGAHDRYHSLERLEGDLRAFEGDVVGARSSYGTVLGVHKGIRARLHLGRLLELHGDWDEAADVYAPLRKGWMSAETADRRVVFASEAWWASLDDEARVEELAAALARPIDRRGFLIGLAERSEVASELDVDVGASALARDAFERLLETHLDETLPDLPVSRPAPRAPTLRDLAVSREWLTIPESKRTSLSPDTRRTLARIALSLDASSTVDRQSALGLRAVLEAVVLPVLVRFSPGRYAPPSGPLIRSLNGDSTGLRFGSQIASLPDQDGDGREELVVLSSGVEDRGDLRLFRGESEQPSWGFEIPGELSGRRAVLGETDDIDGDGHSDLLLGLPQVGPGRVLVVSGIDGRVLLQIDGESDGPPFGRQITRVSDRDGDGRTDLAIASGSPLSDYSPSSVTVRSSRDGSELARYDATWAGAQIGIGMVCPGDLDGDGEADVVLTAAGLRNLRASWVIAWSPGREPRWTFPFDGDQDKGGGVTSTSDIDGDGVNDIVAGRVVWGGYAHAAVTLLSGRTGRQLWIRRAPRGDGWGNVVETLPDLDGDGHSDLAVGASRHCESGPCYVEVVSGATGESLARICSTALGCGLGAAIDLIGDQDGDGTADLAVGAPAHDGGGTNAGAVWIFSGARLRN